MNKKYLYISAAFRARPGKETELRDALQALQAPTRAEPGCLTYDLHQGPGDPARLMMFETWETQTAIDAHMKSPHVQKFAPRVDGLCAEPPQILIWERVG
jgi:quinol monooxygenase YgiN